MPPAPQFVVTFRGFEIGRYETAERAMAAARSVIDTELGSQLGRGEPPSGALPIELPRIEWQPPPIPFPFDAGGYWHWRAQTLASQRRPPAPPRPAPPVPQGPEPMPARRPDDVPQPGATALIPGGPPPRPDPPAATVITPIPGYDGATQPAEDPMADHRRWLGKDDE